MSTEEKNDYFYNHNDLSELIADAIFDGRHTNNIKFIPLQNIKTAE